MANVNTFSEDNERHFFGKKIIAFLDILGFSDLVENNNHSTLINLYQSLIVNHVTMLNKLATNQARIQAERFGDKAYLSGLRLINMSDSIVLCIDNSRETSLLDLFYEVRSLMTVAMAMGIPLRGAITSGDFNVLESNGNISIVGKALVNAYRMEQCQEWSGCIVDDEIFTRLREYELIMKESGKLPVVERNAHLIIKYDIPLKSGVKNSYAVNWPMFDFLTEELVGQAFSAHNKSIENAAIRIKIENTIRFFQYCRDNTKPPIR